MMTEQAAVSPVRDRTYRYGSLEKLQLVLPCIRQRFWPKRNLLAGPYAGEFGYELMQWQGFVRARRRFYDQVHVVTYPGRDYLYEDCQVHYHDINLKGAGYWYGRLSPVEARQLAEAKIREIGLKDCDIFDTSLLCTRYHKALFFRQEFRLLQETPLRASPWDVVLHFRAIRKEGPDDCKNYPPALADELAARCLERGLSIACIGHPDYSYCPAACADHRSQDLRQTVAAISSAHAAVGEASGGMHLVNACGKPTIIWGDGWVHLGPAFRWNPFRVPLYVVANETWRPTPQQVCDAIVQALADLKERTQNFKLPAYTLPAQPIFNY